MWTSTESIVLLNPRMPELTKKQLLYAKKSIPEPPAHVWMTSSGTSGAIRWVVLSKQAVLISADAVNRHLNVNAADVWLNPLPLFHVGGLGIAARAYVSGSKVGRYSGKWKPLTFVQQIVQIKATLTALVPTQVYDLIAAKLEAPKHLRAVVIGGGALSQSLYFAALQLGWLLLPSYGLTECASQVATAALPTNSHLYPSLTPLPHVSLSVDREGKLKIKSPSLLTAYVDCTEREAMWHDPKIDGWFTTEDCVEMKDGNIVSVHRESDFIKVGGESVDMTRLDNLLEELKMTLGVGFDAALAAVPDARLGHAVHLAVTTADHNKIQPLMDRYHEHVHPFERIRAFHTVTEIPRSPLKKIKRKELQQNLLWLCSSKKRGNAASERAHFYV